ncbi:MAG TPA: OmpA family protein, partial [Bacteroidia bacterium]|nr:OmpA family protein [Bacteroidia bacterium]
MKRIIVLLLTATLFCIIAKGQNCTVHFMSDSFRLTSGEQKVLDDFVDSLGTELFNYRITVSGFTDATGAHAYNDTLSNERARAVGQYLETKGIRKDNIVEEHHGPDRPVASNGTEDGKAQNRRVEVKAEKWDDIVMEKMNMHVPVEQYRINAQKGGTITTKSGQQIFIPPDALVDQHGKKVKGDVVIEFTEYKDAVDMLFSGFPMSYTENGTEHDYQSGGMFSIRAFQNNKLLSISADTSIRIHYNISDTTRKYNFYRFNGADATWDKEHPDAIDQGQQEDLPKNDQPKADHPATDQPKTDQPKTDQPKTDQPQQPQIADQQKIIDEKKKKLIGYIDPCTGMK